MGAIDLVVVGVVDLLVMGVVGGVIVGVSVGVMVRVVVMVLSPSIDCLRNDGGCGWLGGIVAKNNVNVTVVLDGTVVADPDFAIWPVDPQTKDYAHIFHFVNCRYLTVCCWVLTVVANFIPRFI